MASGKNGQSDMNDHEQAGAGDGSVVGSGATGSVAGDGGAADAAAADSAPETGGTTAVDSGAGEGVHALEGEILRREQVKIGRPEIRSEQDLALTDSASVVAIAGRDMALDGSSAVVLGAGRDVHMTDSAVFVARSGGDMQVENSGGAAAYVAGGNIHLEHSGGAAYVAGGNIDINNGGGAAFFAGGNMQVTNGGGGGFIARGDVNVTNGGGAVLAAGRDLSVAYAPTSFPAGALLLAGRNAWIQDGHIGILISNRAVVDRDSQVLVNIQLPHFFGSLVDKALSLADGLLGWFEG